MSDEKKPDGEVEEATLLEDTSAAEPDGVEPIDQSPDFVPESIDDEEGGEDA